MPENLAAHRQSGNSAAIVFVHGFGGDLKKTWGEMPAFLKAEKRLKGWDIFSLGYASSLRCDVAGLWSADPPLSSVAGLLLTHVQGVGRQLDAIALLQSHDKTHTDAMGVLAGRLKRRWLAERVEADGEAARQLYAEALAEAEAREDHAQAFYHGINLAFMDLVLRGNKNAAQESARKVLSHCGQADRDKWSLATQGEAHLLLGETEKAVNSYRVAVAENPSPREMQSMYQQATLVARHMRNREAEQELASVFG